MGQSSSKKERRAVSEVQRRTRENNEQRPQRPVSYTYGASNTGPDMDPSAAPRFGVNTGSMDLSGLRFQGYPKDPDVRTNPIGAEEDEVDESDIASSSQSPPVSPTSPTGKSIKVDKAEAKAVYLASLEEILGIWPEYQSLRDFKPNKTPSQLQTTLQQVYKRLVEQHVSIGNTSRQNHDLRLQLQTHKNDLESLESIVKDREKDLQECNNDIGFLRGELKRRGYDPKIPGRNQQQSDRRQNAPNDGDPRRHSRLPSDISDEVLYENTKQEIVHKLQKKESRGQVRATPLLLAEGMDGLGTALKRASSFKSAQHQGGSFDRDAPRSSFRDRELRSRGEEENRLIEDLNERLRRLQDSLEKERRNNDALQRRLDEAAQESPRQHNGGAAGVRVTADELSGYYANLESDAMYKVLPIMDRVLGHVPEYRKQEFVCSIMLKCYEHASRNVQRFEKAITGLLLHPLDKLESGHPYDGNGPLSASLSSGQKFSYFEPKKGKVPTQTEVPNNLLDELLEFLESAADDVNLTPLAQIVVDDLSEEFSDCTTPALLNHTGFNHFLYDCARLAWKMILITPPLSLSTDKGRGFDSRSHTIASSAVLTPRSGHPIDHFLWPTLLTRRHGEILSKGRVILQADR